jgi:hypothetical protein
MPSVTSRVIGILLVALAFAKGRPLHADEIGVVASIKPVHSWQASCKTSARPPCW